MTAIRDKTMITGYQTLIPSEDWIPYEGLTGGSERKTARFLPKQDGSRPEVQFMQDSAFVQ